MAPLVWGERETMHQMLWYMAILIPLTLLPVTFGAFGMIYLVSATVLGLVMLWSIVRTVRATAWTQPAWWSYRFSLLYLALLFVAMVVDRRVAL
jgi:protoheme IX farnesyltransferase